MRFLYRFRGWGIGRIRLGGVWFLILVFAVIRNFVLNFSILEMEIFRTLDFRFFRVKDFESFEWIVLYFRCS